MDTVLIREMTQNDRIGVSEIYTYAIEEGSSTFTYHCPSYSQWDEEHHKDCNRLVRAQPDFSERSL